MRTSVVGAVLALVLAGCGETASRDGGPRRSAAAAPAAAHASARAPRTLIVFRRVRYAGATLRTMYVRADGSLKIDVPGGGAGGAKFAGQLTRHALRGIRHALSATPWGHLSHRRVFYDGSGAYFMLLRRGQDYVAMANGMSPDLRPLVARLDDVLNGAGQVSEHKVVHRFGKV